MNNINFNFETFLPSITLLQERSTLMKRLSMLKDLEVDQSVLDGSDFEEPVSITGLETFSLGYKVCGYS